MGILGYVIIQYSKKKFLMFLCIYKPNLSLKILNGNYSFNEYVYLERPHMHTKRYYCLTISVMSSLGFFVFFFVSQSRLAFSGWFWRKHLYPFHSSCCIYFKLFMCVCIFDMQTNVLYLYSVFRHCRKSFDFFVCFHKIMQIFCLYHN